MTLGPVQHCVEAIGGTASIATLKYIAVKIGATERILPHAIRQKFDIAPDGTLEPVTAGSTRPTSAVVTGAGVQAVEQFDLRAP